MAHVESDLFARLGARLDAQEQTLAAQEAELAGLRAKVVLLEGTASVAPPPPARQEASPAMPVPRRAPAASRRALLKGAGALVFTTALLATGEVVPVAPYRVAAADPPPSPSGPAPAIATAADTLYQSVVGTDFHPEVTSLGEAGVNAGSVIGGGPIYPATTGTQNFSARVTLPQGATVVEVIFYVLHNDTATMSVGMAAYGVDSGGFSDIGNTSVSVNSPSIQTINVPLFLPNVVVDNAQYSYVFNWFPTTGSATAGGATQKLYGARVGYTLPNSAQIYGSASAGIGVSGTSTSGIGVRGTSSNSIGVSGTSSTSGAGVQGVSATGAGVSGSSTSAAGVQGVSTSGLGGKMQGGLAPLLLVPASSGTGHPTTGSHAAGELYVDSANTLFYCTAAGTPGTWQQLTGVAVITLGATASTAGTTEIDVTGSANNTVALKGVNLSSGTSGVGLLGQADGSTGAGVKGTSAAGTGVQGVSASGYPVVGQITGAGNINAGVLGVGTAGPGVQGQSTNGYGLVGFTNATDGHAALIGYANAAGGIGVLGNAPGGASPGLAGVFNGDVRINSGALHAPVLQAVVKHPGDNSYRLLYSEEATESWFADYGRGTLAGDKAEITLDPDFAALVYSDTYHVFLTPHGPQHLHVAQQSATGFTVMAMAWATQGGGPKPAEGGGTFSYRVVAKRKDIAGERLAKVDPPPPLKPVTPFTVPEASAPKPPTTKP